MKRSRKNTREGPRKTQQNRQRAQDSDKNPMMEKLLNFRLCVPIVEEACALTVSTRGIGFMLSKITNYLRDCFPKLNTEPPIAAMYRASLAQLEARIYFARSKQTRPFFLGSPSESPFFEVQPVMDYNRAQLLQKYSTNLSQITFIINSIGHFELNNIHYEPKFSSESTPLNVRISNLRKYCEEMANPETDASKRIAGYELNSIPTAKWLRSKEDDPNSIVLTNPDDIIPADYNNYSLTGDLMKTLSYVQRISSKRPDCRGVIDYERDGDPGLLVSTHIGKEQVLRLDDERIVQYHDKDRNFWSRESIDCYSWTTGIATLAGEVSNITDVPHRSKKLAVLERNLTWEAASFSLYSLDWK